jgi:hypothetical protein
MTIKTIREALIAKVQIAGFDANAIEVALIDNELPGDEDYTPATHRKVVEKAALEVLHGMVQTSFTEGDMTKTWSLDAINKRIAFLSGTGTPKVRAISVW